MILSARLPSCNTKKNKQQVDRFFFQIFIQFILLSDILQKAFGV
jgi:hypothetical protein